MKVCLVDLTVGLSTGRSVSQGEGCKAASSRARAAASLVGMENHDEPDMRTKIQQHNAFVSQWLNQVEDELLAQKRFSLPLSILWRNIMPSLGLGTNAEVRTLLLEDPHKRFTVTSQRAENMESNALVSLVRASVEDIRKAVLGGKVVGAKKPIIKGEAKSAAALSGESGHVMKAVGTEGSICKDKAKSGAATSWKSAQVARSVCTEESLGKDNAQGGEQAGKPAQAARAVATKQILAESKAIRATRSAKSNGAIVCESHTGGTAARGVAVHDEITAEEAHMLAMLLS